MVNLLDMPREIRDQVLDIILHDPHSQPWPTTAAVEKSNTKRDPNDLSAKKIRYPPSGEPSTAIKALMLVSRQLNRECHESIDHFVKCGMAELTVDLLVESNKWLYPTWIQALPYRPYIGRLLIRIRPFRSSAADVVGDPFVAAWHFGDFLNVILKYGPSFNFSRNAKPAVVKELVLDIVTDPSLVRPGGTEMEVSDQVKSLRNFMISHIDGFLVVRHKRYHAPWGPILLSQVRTLRIVEYGETSACLDVLQRAHDCNVKVYEPPLKASTLPPTKPKPKSLQGSFVCRRN